MVHGRGTAAWLADPLLLNDVVESGWEGRNGSINTHAVWLITSALNSRFRVVRQVLAVGERRYNTSTYRAASPSYWREQICGKAENVMCFLAAAFRTESWTRPVRGEGERVQTETSCLVQIRSRAEKGAVMHRMWGWKQDVSAAVSTWHFLKKNTYFRSGVVRGGSSALSCLRKLCLLSAASDEA